ncbi:MAG: hypothetical protein ACKV2T_19500 [Kofleriaceae bacterium]
MTESKTTCRHLLCEIVDGTVTVKLPDDVVPDCSLAIQRSRGTFAKTVAPEVIEEVRALLGAIDPDARTDEGKTAATRLAEIVRREAMEERNLHAQVRDDDAELGKQLARLLARR